MPLRPNAGVRALTINQNCMAMSHSQARLVLLIFLWKILRFTDQLINPYRIGLYVSLRIYEWGLQPTGDKSSCIREGVKEQEVAIRILIDIRITFDKEKRGCVWHLQVFSSIFELPSTKRNEDVYDISRYSHRHSNYLRQRETRMYMASSGILIDIRITFDEEKRGCVGHLQVVPSIFELP